MAKNCSPIKKDKFIKINHHNKHNSSINKNLNNYYNSQKNNPVINYNSKQNIPPEIQQNHINIINIPKYFKYCELLHLNESIFEIVTFFSL